MKAYTSFSKAQKFVELYLEGQFGECSLVMQDFAIDKSSGLLNHRCVRESPIYLGIRENGTAGASIFESTVKDALSQHSDPFAIIKFAYDESAEMYTVEMKPFKK